MGFKTVASKESQKLIEELVAKSDGKLTLALVEYGAEMYSSGVADVIKGLGIGALALLIPLGGLYAYDIWSKKKRLKTVEEAIEGVKIANEAMVNIAKAEEVIGKMKEESTQ